MWFKIYLKLCTVKTNWLIMTSHINKFLPKKLWLYSAKNKTKKTTKTQSPCLQSSKYRDLFLIVIHICHLGTSLSSAQKLPVSQEIYLTQVFCVFCELEMGLALGGYVIWSRKSSTLLSFNIASTHPSISFHFPYPLQILIAY